MAYHKVLCKNFQAFYVPGLGGSSESSSSDALKSIRESIISLDHEEDRLKFVKNYATGLLARNKDERLLNKIKDLAKTHSCNRCGKISFIIFGHSHGGETVVRAFESMKEEMSAADFKKIRDRSAVITMGSPKYIDSKHAEITLNVLLENDNVAKAAAGLVEQNGAQSGNNFMLVGPVINQICQCCKSSKEGRLPTEGKLPVVGYFGGISCGATASLNWSTCSSSCPSCSSSCPSCSNSCPSCSNSCPSLSSCGPSCSSSCPSCSNSCPSCSSSCPLCSSSCPSCSNSCPSCSSSCRSCSNSCPSLSSCGPSWSSSCPSCSNSCPLCSSCRPSWSSSCPSCSSSCPSCSNSCPSLSSCGPSCSSSCPSCSNSCPSWSSCGHSCSSSCPSCSAAVPRAPTAVPRAPAALPRAPAAVPRGSAAVLGALAAVPRSPTSHNAGVGRHPCLTPPLVADATPGNGHYSKEWKK